MTSPRPGSWIKPDSTPSPSSTAPSEEGTSKSTPKKPFVRKPNLTDRPFKDHEGLEGLRDSLRTSRGSRSSTKSGRSKPSSPKRTVKKTDNKENN